MSYVAGSVTFYRGYQIIQSNDQASENHKKFHCYDAGGNLVGIYDRLTLVKSKILNIDFEGLHHNGVVIIEKTNSYGSDYLLSIKREFIDRRPHYLDMDFYILSDLLKQNYHNESGPSVINLTSGETLYFWHGKEYPKAVWEKIVSENKFNSKFSDWLDKDE